MGGEFPIAVDGEGIPFGASGSPASSSLKRKAEKTTETRSKRCEGTKDQRRNHEFLDNKNVLLDISIPISEEIKHE